MNEDELNFVTVKIIFVINNSILVEKYLLFRVFFLLGRTV